jgi:hypothetical protein
MLIADLEGDYAALVQSKPMIGDEPWESDKRRYAESKKALRDFVASLESRIATLTQELKSAEADAVEWKLFQADFSRLTAENEARQKIIEAVERFDAIMYANKIPLPLTDSGLDPMGALWNIRHAIAELRQSKPDPLAALSSPPEGSEG